MQLFCFLVPNSILFNSFNLQPTYHLGFLYCSLSVLGKVVTNKINFFDKNNPILSSKYNMNILT